MAARRVHGRSRFVGGAAARFHRRLRGVRTRAARRLRDHLLRAQHRAAVEFKIPVGILFAAAAFLLLPGDAAILQTDADKAHPPAQIAVEGQAAQQQQKQGEKAQPLAQMHVGKAAQQRAQRAAAHAEVIGLLEKIAVAEGGLHVIAVFVDIVRPEHVQSGVEQKHDQHVRQRAQNTEALAARRPGKGDAKPDKRQRQNKAQIAAQAAQRAGKTGKLRHAPGKDEHQQTQQRQREAHAGGNRHVRPFRPFFDNSRLLFCHDFPPKPPPAHLAGPKWALRRILYYTGRT